MSGNLLFKAMQTASELLGEMPLQGPSNEEAGEGRALGGYSRRLNMGKLGRRVGGGLAASKLRTGAAGGSGGMLASGSQREFD